MIGSRRVKTVCLALLGLLALLVFCASASARERDAYVANSGDGTVSVIDYSSNAVLGSIPVGGEPVDVAITPDGQIRLGRRRRRPVGLGLGDRHEDQDRRPGRRSRSATAPRGIAITPNGGRAYVDQLGRRHGHGPRHRDLRAGRRTDPVGKEPDGVAISPDGGSAFVAQRGGGIAVIDTNKAEVVETIDDPFGPSRITITPDGGRGFVTNHLADTVTAFSPAGSTR